MGFYAFQSIKIYVLLKKYNNGIHEFLSYPCSLHQAQEIDASKAISKVSPTIERNHKHKPCYADSCSYINIALTKFSLDSNLLMENLSVPQN